MKTTTLCIIFFLIFFRNIGLSEIIDQRRVYNPELNGCLKVFGVSGYTNNHTGYPISQSSCFKAERIFLNWIAGPDSPDYLKDFDTTLFHYQFLENSALGNSKTAVIVIVPDSLLRNSFYTTLGEGLEIPGIRCIGAHCTWINDGEIFSFTVDHSSESVDGFRNWRFEQEDFYENPVMAYYSLLSINYKCKTKDAENTTIVQFVDGVFRNEIPAWEHYPVLMPKQKISVLVFYCKGLVKGVLCFDMRDISKGCPMNFESTVYLKERLGYGRILYARPKCEGIYPISLIERNYFEELTSMKWEHIEEFKEDLATN